MELLAEKLQHLKRNVCLTTEEIAAQSGIPLGTLNKLFSGATKVPVLRTLQQLAETLHVPVDYFTDDDTPVFCDTAVFLPQQGVLTISAQEQALLLAYRKIPDYSRRFLAALAEELCLHTSVECHLTGPVKKVLCCIPVAAGERGVYGDAFEFRPILMEVDAITTPADFAVFLSGTSLSPYYHPGAVLALRRCQAHHNQLGAFLLNGEGYIRKFYCQRGVRKLIALSSTFRDIRISGEDELRCMGTVLGSVRSYQWV